MKNISILGCGWLGFALGQYLIEKGFSVKGSTTSQEKLQKLKDAGIQPFLIQVKVDQIEGKDIGDFWESDVLIINFPPGRRHPNVLTNHPKQVEHILAANQSKRIIYTSSTGVYGDEKAVARETDPLSPTRDSTKAIVQVEQQLTDTEVIILRLAGLVGGDRQAGRFFTGKTNVTDPKKPVNMVHRDDVIAIIHQVIVQERWNEIFNVCADEHPTKEDFYTQQALKLDLVPPQFAAFDSEKIFKMVDNSKVKRVLNYVFLHPDPMQF